MRLQVFGSNDIDVSSEGHLRRELKRLHLQLKPQPAIVALLNANGDNLALGLGRDPTQLTFVSGRDPDDYCVSVGDIYRGIHPVLTFYYLGHQSEYPAFSAIPVDAAIDAMAAYFTTGTLPSTIAWEPTLSGY